MRSFLLVFIGLLLFPFAAPMPLHAAPDVGSTPPETDLTALPQPGRHVVSLHLGDYDRKFIFVTPPGFKAGTPLPIVFFFHGAGGSAEGAANMYGWVEKAEAENFFAVFPDGLPARPEDAANFRLNPRLWRDGRPMANAGIDDAGFFDALLTRLQAAMPIDPRRIYATGFSNGGGLCFVLASRFPDRVAAIAPVSTGCFVEPEKLARPVSVYYLTGSADPLVPYHGGTMTSPWGTTHLCPPVQDFIDLWVRLDGCPTQAQVVGDEDGVRVLRYGPGMDGAEVIFTTVEGNGHHWPGTSELLPASVVGPSLDTMKATDSIWDFFRSHPLSEAGKI